MSNTITTAEFRSWVNLIADGPDGSQQFFSKYVDPNVDWTVTTPATGALGKTTPIAGEYTSLQAFVQGAVLPIDACFTQGITMTIIDAFVQPTADNDGTNETNITKAVVEMKGTGTIKATGEAWENYYSWVFHFDNTTQKAILVRAYLDSAAVNIAMSA